MNNQDGILYFEIEESGYGAMISRIMTGLGIALAHNKNPVFSMNGNYYKFPFNSIEQKKMYQLPPFNFDNKSGDFQWHFSPYWNNIFLRKKYQYPSCPFPNMKMSNNQWCAFLIQKVMSQPTKEFDDFFQNAYTRLFANIQRPVIGIHIRRGDKPSESPNVPESVYLKYLNELITSKKIENYSIFLSSDDPYMYDSFKKIIPSSVQLIWDFTEKRYNDDNKKHARESQEIALQESYTAAKNILLLGKCDYVIGTHNAQFTWLGGLLCVASHDMDGTRHIMIDPHTHKPNHWGESYLK